MNAVVDAIDRIRIIRSDVTKEAVNAIVNAANPQLTNDGGVAGAIRRAGGPSFQPACDELVAERGPVPVGGAVATDAFDLPCKKVIHAVGPIYGQQGGREAELLARAHRSSIALAGELGLRAIAFPAISCGIYGYPVAEAAPVALAATLEALERHPLELVRFCFIAERERSAFQQALDALRDA